MRLKNIEDKINKNTRAIILIHYGGIPCEDIDKIIDLCLKNNIALIEDSACSVASKYKGRSCGTLGDFGVFSFDAMKILVTGDGGMVYSKDLVSSEKIEKIAYLGLESKSGLSQIGSNRWWEFEISSFGNRQIINDISGAIGIEQLKKLDGFIGRRKKIHEIYTRELGSLSWLQLPPDIPQDIKSSYYFYWIQTKFRDELSQYLKIGGVYTTFRYYPLHKVKYYGCSDIVLKNAEEASEITLCIPIHQSLSDNDVSKIVDLIKGFKT